MKILLLSRYSRNGASTRLRTLQYIPHLESRGFEIDVSPLFSEKYLEAFNSGRPRLAEAGKCYLKRSLALLKVKKYDLLWIEKELFSYLPALPERFLSLSGVPYVADYDDAIFHRYDCHRLYPVRLLLGRKIDAVMAGARAVIAGNSYLAERAVKAGARRVEIVPTVVDAERYVVKEKSTGPVTIGWIGSRTTTPYFSGIVPVIREAVQESSQAAVKTVIAAVGAYRDYLPHNDVMVFPWSEETEVSEIGKFDIGVMPLPDSSWERGKCGYKLIQYMACGLPVVASPVGVNRDIVKNGINGYLAETPEEWKKALSILIKDKELRIRMGKEGRKLVEEKYSLSVQAPVIEKILEKSAGKKLVNG